MEIGDVNFRSDCPYVDIVVCPNGDRAAIERTLAALSCVDIYKKIHFVFERKPGSFRAKHKLIENSYRQGYGKSLFMDVTEYRLPGSIKSMLAMLSTCPLVGAYVRPFPMKTLRKWVEINDYEFATACLLESDFIDDVLAGFPKRHLRGNFWGVNNREIHVTKPSGVYLDPYLNSLRYALDPGSRVFYLPKFSPIEFIESRTKRWRSRQLSAFVDREFSVMYRLGYLLTNEQSLQKLTQLYRSNKDAFVLLLTKKWLEFFIMKMTLREGMEIQIPTVPCSEGIILTKNMASVILESRDTKRLPSRWNRKSRIYPPPIGRYELMREGFLTKIEVKQASDFWLDFTSGRVNLSSI